MDIWIQSFIELIFPRLCLVCDASLTEKEKHVCFSCMKKMPRTYLYEKGNLMEQSFWGRLPIERAAAYFSYQKDGVYKNIILYLKYKGVKEVGKVMGYYFAKELLKHDFFDGMDVIVPVPLHKRRLRKRGYNQSEWIAAGISEISGIPMDTTAVMRVVYTDTQTKKSRTERFLNVDKVFVSPCPERFAGKHILLIDDVFTTGSTLIACARAFEGVEGVRFSVLTLGKA
jgi:ComF family protein